MDQKYQDDVLEKIKKIKSGTFGSISISGSYQQKTYELLLLTTDTVENPDVIQLLSNWRKKHEEWFQAVFPITNERTAKWLRIGVIGAKDRILFMLKTENAFIGHLGLYRFDFEVRSCEIDNIVRGENGYPGIIGNAIITMQNWAKNKFGLKAFTLQTTSDNSKALSLYKKLGYVETLREPLVKVETNDGSEWIHAPKEHNEEILRFNVHMEFKNA